MSDLSDIGDVDHKVMRREQALCPCGSVSMCFASRLHGVSV
jgi:hypothetical protein